MKYIPNLKGLIDPRIAAEINRAFNSMYEHFDEQLKKLESNTSSQTTAIIRKQLDLFAGTLAMPIIDPTGNQLATAGQETTLVPADIPNLDASKITSGVFPLARIPSNVLKTDDGLTITPGLIAVGGKITIKDNAGNSVNVLVE